jgi:hypothetical protein
MHGMGAAIDRARAAFAERDRARTHVRGTPPLARSAPLRRTIEACMHRNGRSVMMTERARVRRGACMLSQLTIYQYIYVLLLLTASPPVQEPVACRADTACPATHTADVLQGALAIGTFVDGASLQQLASGGRCEG